jgi:hypothetical protein
MGAGVWRAVFKPLPRVWSLPDNVVNLEASIRVPTLESDGMVKRLNTRKHRHRRMSHTRLVKAQAKTARWPGSGSLTWPDANGVPPVYRVDLTRPVVNAEHGKAVGPAWAPPRQADRKAGPGETAMRGSKKPRPGCNGPDRPTSIWSLMVRASMEPFPLRTANDDRLRSIGASQTRRQERRRLRPSVRMAKVASVSNAGELTGAFPSDKALPRGLSRYEGKLSCPVPRGA